jgi:hypothetical protein
MRPGLDRRRAVRAEPGDTPWQAAAVVRPGLVVRVLNISAHGALVESSGRLRPGRTAELQLTTVEGDDRVVARGLVGRCRVARLAPLCYQGAIAFETPLAEIRAGG